jgi:hypothetical protein
MGRLLMMMANTLSVNRKNHEHALRKKGIAQKKQKKEGEETKAEKYLGEKIFANKL